MEPRLDDDEGLIGVGDSRANRGHQSFFIVINFNVDRPGLHAKAERLGVRSRHFWNGHWWVHTRFCSTHCELIYEQEQKNAAVERRCEAFLARGNPRANGRC